MTDKPKRGRPTKAPGERKKPCSHTLTLEQQELLAIMAQASGMSASSWVGRAIETAALAAGIRVACKEQPSEPLMTHPPCFWPGGYEF